MQNALLRFAVLGDNFCNSESGRFEGLGVGTSNQQ